MQEFYYDSGEDGEIRRFSFHAYVREGEEALCVDTDMDIARLEVFATRRIDKILMNGSVLEDRRG